MCLPLVRNYAGSMTLCTDHGYIFSAAELEISRFFVVYVLTYIQGFHRDTLNSKGIPLNIVLYSFSLHVFLILRPPRG